MGIKYNSNSDVLICAMTIPATVLEWLPATASGVPFYGYTVTICTSWAAPLELFENQEGPETKQKPIVDYGHRLTPRMIGLGKKNMIVLYLYTVLQATSKSLQ